MKISSNDRESSASWGEMRSDQTRLGEQDPNGFNKKLQAMP